MFYTRAIDNDPETNYSRRMYGGEVSAGKCLSACPKCGAPPDAQTFRYCPGNTGFACDTSPRHEIEAFHLACGACAYRYLAPVEKAREVVEPEQPESKRAPRTKRAR